MTTRRDFLWRGAAAAGVIAFTGFPCPTVLAGPTADFYAWHNKTLDEHIQLRDTYFNLGYRFRSVSVYGGGTANSSYFAAVVIKRPIVVTQRDFPLIAEGEFQAVFDAQAKQNYGPAIIAACGPPQSPVFSAVFEPQNPIPLVRVGLVSSDNTSYPNSIQAVNTQAKAQGLRMRWAASYGDANHPSFAGIWVPNPDNTSWNCDGLLDDDAACQQRFDAEATAWCRPSLITLNQDLRFLQLFENNQIGDWYAVRNLNATSYQSAFDGAVRKGFFPLTVQAAGADRNTASFAAVFAQSENPVPRQWSVTGPVTSAAIDAVMRQSMTNTPVRQAAIAIVHGTKLVYARAYTLAEPGWPVVQPSTYFRLASVSKTIASLALFQLIERGELNLDDKLQDILHLQTPTGAAPTDPSFNSVTIAELFEHTSNLDPDDFRNSAAIMQAFQAANKPASLPINIEMTDSYVATLPLQPPPQAMYYNNCGYHLLGRVLAKKRNTALAIDAIRQYLLAPLSITRIRQSVSLLSAQHPDEARQQDPNLGLSASVMAPARPLVPDDYGDWNMEVDETAGGYSGAVTDVARLVAILIDPKDNAALKRSTLTAMFDKAVANQIKWSNPPFKTNNPRAGYGLDGAGNLGQGQYYGQKGGNGVGWNAWIQFNGDWGLVVCLGGLAGQNWGDNAYPDFPDVMNLAQFVNWGTNDLFPQFGMPSL